MVRCANCHRPIVKTVPVMLGRVPFGPTCAAQLGIIRPRGPSPPTLTVRSLDLAPHTTLAGQLDLYDLLDLEQ